MSICSFMKYSLYCIQLSTCVRTFDSARAGSASCSVAIGTAGVSVVKSDKQGLHDALSPNICGGEIRARSHLVCARSHLKDRFAPKILCWSLVDEICLTRSQKHLNKPSHRESRRPRKFEKPRAHANYTYARIAYSCCCRGPLMSARNRKTGGTNHPCAQLCRSAGWVAA